MAGAVEYVKGVIRHLLMNKVDMSLLVVTKVDTCEAVIATLVTAQHSCRHA
jgi:hypothetical protein